MTRQKFEYKKVQFDEFGPSKQELNDLGGNGWEMCGIIYYSGFANPYAVYHFKRSINKQRATSLEAALAPSVETSG